MNGMNKMNEVSERKAIAQQLCAAPQQQLNLSSTPINHQLNTNQKSLVLLIGLVELVELIERN